MINAVLVFNNAGQPRLTKFYTQLVWPPLLLPPRHDSRVLGNQRPAAPHLGDLHAGREPSQLGM
jgi:hypothetical protein